MAVPPGDPSLPPTPFLPPLFSFISPFFFSPFFLPRPLLACEIYASLIARRPTARMNMDDAAWIVIAGTQSKAVR